MKVLADGRHFDDTKYDPRYKYNIYVCSRRHAWLSCDVDQGVTPMFITCRQRSCQRTAGSQMYPDVQKITENPRAFPVDLVWRKPTKDELRRARRDNFIDHYEKGGLAMEWLVSR